MLSERFAFTYDHSAIRLDRPFFDHVEAWPDIILPELRVAIEYDSTGRHGLEHVGPRQDTDRRKDRAVRAVGWEVVRIRTGRLPALGPYDLQVSGISGRHRRAAGGHPARRSGARCSSTRTPGDDTDRGTGAARRGTARLGAVASDG